MPGNKSEVSDAEVSPRSRFGKFFGWTESKKEKELPTERKKKYENEWSQTNNNDEGADTQQDGKEPKKIVEKIPKEKPPLEEKPDKLPSEYPETNTQKLIETDLAPEKLTALINHSIKEAVRSIVKDGVCDFVESQEFPNGPTKKQKNRETNKIPELTEEPPPAREYPRDKSTLLTSEEKKTFDSHSQDPARGRKSPTPYKSPGRAPADQCDRSICPAYAVEDAGKLKRSRSRRRHKPQFSTDNRRMTGNVNIYICSEANENMKRKSQDKDRCLEASESGTEQTKSTTSASSVSTSKLITALKRKRRKKIESKELECLCEEPEEPENAETSTKKISEPPDNEIISSSNKSDELKDNISSNDYLDGCSLENCPAFSTNSYNHFSYDNDSWDPRRNSPRNYPFLAADRDESARETLREPLCSCKRPKSTRVPGSCCVCESERQFNSIATNYPEDRKLSTVCIREPPAKLEEIVRCESNAPEEFTVCGRIPASANNEEIISEAIKKPESVESAAEVKNEITVVEKEEEAVKPNESEIAPILDNREKESFLLRSWKKAVGLVKAAKTAIPTSLIEAKEPEKIESSDPKIKETHSSEIKPKSQSSSTVNTSQTVRRERRSNSKIVTAISSKQKQREAASDSKLPVDSTPPKPEAQPKPQKSEEKPENETNCKCVEPKEPKTVPCPFYSQPEEPKVESICEEICPQCCKPQINCSCCKKCCNTDELGRCECNRPICKPREPTCCTCKRETSCCTCRQLPTFRSPKPCRRICRFCCNPQNRCTCRGPVRKCSYCGMSSDICNCHEGPLWTEGRPIAIPEGNSGFRVTAWKPRPEIAAYFSRERIDLQGNPNDCRCDKNKPYGSDELPYQKLNVFSNVMTELQQKISDSVYCNLCNNTPCCCPKSPRCLSTIPEKPTSQRRNQSPPDCKCPHGSRKITTFAVCDDCRTIPCRCRKDKRPQAKCFYCKTMPCRCECKAAKRFAYSKNEKTEATGRKRNLGCRCLSPKRPQNKRGEDPTPVQRHR